MNFHRHARAWALAASLALLAFSAPRAEPSAADPEVFAIVGDTVLSAADFRAAYNRAARSKFYHSRPPEGEIAVFQRQVGDQLIDRVLLVKEAKRRGLRPDAEAVKARLARYEERARHAPEWAKSRDKWIAAMTEQFENQSVYEQLERQVTTVPEPAEAEARRYYERNPERFREPEQVRLSVILLKVDPSSPTAVWEAAREEAGRIHGRLKAGADFAELAKLHSGDPTASAGGDMGYVHRGMLPEQVHKIIDDLKAGELTEPMPLLEGVAVLRLVDRKPAHQRTFAEVRERAADLWQREEANGRWRKLIDQLRGVTVIKINDQHYLPLAAQAGN